MDYEKNEQVVFVKDLLFAAMYRWRGLLAAALVGAVLLGGIGAVASYRAVKNAPSIEVQQEAIAKYEEEKASLEARLEKDKALVDSQEEYMRNSALLSLDPYCVYTATVSMYVQTDYQILPGMAYQNPDNAAAIVKAYQTYMNGDRVVQTVAQTMELESKYLWELITISTSSDTNNLTVTVRYSTAEGAEKILDAVLTHLEQARKQITETVGKHTINTVTNEVNRRIDMSVIDKQTAAETYLANLRAKQERTLEALNALTMPTFITSFSVKKVVILAILGAILGAALVACVAWFKHLSGSVVYSARTLTNKTGLKVLNRIPGKATSNPVDKWLKKLEGRALSAEQTAVMAATVRNYCAPAEHVLLVGDCDISQQEQVAQALKQAGVETTVVGSLLRCPNAQQALAEHTAVLLVETCGVSRYSNILLSMEQIQDHNKRLIGCVLLEG